MFVHNNVWHNDCYLDVTSRALCRTGACLISDHKRSFCVILLEKPQQNDAHNPVFMSHTYCVYGKLYKQKRHLHPKQRATPH